MRLRRKKVPSSSLVTIGVAGAGVAAVAATLLAMRFGRGISTMAASAWGRLRGRGAEDAGMDGQLLMSNRPAPARDVTDPLRQGEPLTANIRPADAIGWASEPEPAF